VGGGGGGEGGEEIDCHKKKCLNSTKNVPIIVCYSSLDKIYSTKQPCINKCTLYKMLHIISKDI
jgi:hypothetical protein